MNFTLVNLDAVGGIPVATEEFTVFNLTTAGGSVLDHDYYGDLPFYDALYYGFTGLNFGGHSDYPQFDVDL